MVSAYVYVKNDKDFETKKTVKSLLEELQKDPANGIERILSGKEAEEKGADDTCTFMLEARRGFYYKDTLEGTFIHEVTPEDVEDKRYTYASHGYSPEKESYATIFMAAGKGIRPNVHLPYMHLTDEGPTFARLLGLNLGETDGKVIEKLLEN